MDCKLLTLLIINQDGQETKNKNEEKKNVNCPEGMIGKKCATTIVVSR